MSTTLRRAVHAGLIAALAVLITSCPNPIAQLVSEDVLLSRAGGHPEIKSISPSNGEEIFLNTAFSVTFSMEMNRESVESAIALVDGADNDIASESSWDATSRIYQMTPSHRLEPGVTYSLKIDAEARNRGGAPLASGTSAEYRTVSVNPDQIRFDLTYDGQELSESAPLYMRFSWSDSDSATVGPYTEEGTILVDKDDLGATPATGYFVEFIHDRNNSYQSGNGSDGTIITPDGSDYLQYYIERTSTYAVDYPGFLYSFSGSDSDYYSETRDDRYAFANLKQGALVGTGEAYLISLRDKPDLIAASDWSSSRDSVTVSANTSFSVDEYSRNFYRFVPPRTEFYVFTLSATTPNLAYDAYLKNESGAIVTGTDHIGSLIEYGGNNVEAFMVGQPRVLQAVLTAGEAYYIEIRQIEDIEGALTAFSHEGTGTVGVELFDIAGHVSSTDAAERLSDNESRADIDTTYDFITGTPGEQTEFYFFDLRADDVDWIRIDDAIAGNDGFARVRASWKNLTQTVFPAFRNQLPWWVQGGYSSGSQVAGNRILTVNVQLYDADGDQLGYNYRTENSSPSPPWKDAAAAGHDVVLSYDTSGGSTPASFFEIRLPGAGVGIPPFDLRIENVTATPSGLTQPTGAYFVDAVPSAGGGK